MHISPLTVKDLLRKQPPLQQETKLLQFDFELFGAEQKKTLLDMQKLVLAELTKDVTQVKNPSTVFK